MQPLRPAGPGRRLLVLLVLAALVVVGGPALADTGPRPGQHRDHHKAHRPTHHQAHPHRRHSASANRRSVLLAGAAAPSQPTQQVKLAAKTVGAPAGWVTTASGSRRVEALSPKELRPSTASSAVHVPVDESTRYQSMDGFGAALTESSAHLLMGLSPAARTSTLRALFDPVSGAGLDLVRLPLGASDFALSHYTYDDIPSGQSDPTLSRFSLAHDDAEIIPVLQEALRINPDLQVMGTPWSAPAWMKTNQSLVGGTLTDGNTDVYAQYLVRTVQALRARGIPLRLLTLGNEPEFAPADYPGMLLSPAQEAALASSLSGQLSRAGITDVQLIGYDHNWDDTAYPTTLLADPAAHAALAGTAFHCYAGNPSAQSVVHAADPEKGIWFTECSGGAWAADFAGNLGWNTGTLLIGATRNWARSVLLWNLALSPQGGPHTGGCDNCRGVLTIDPSTGVVARNVEYDVLALASKGVHPGAVRVATPATVYGVQSVAYLNPDGTHSLTAYNSWQNDQTLVVDAGTVHVGAPLPAGSVVTLTW